MKILYLVTHIPFPLNSGGRRRTYQIIKSLSRSNEIDLVGFPSSPNSSTGVAELSEYCQNVFVVPFTVKHSIIKLLQSFFGGKPYKILQHHSYAMAEKVETLLKENKYDVVICEHLFVEQHIPPVSIPVIPQNNDLNYIVYKQFAKSGKGLMRFYSATQWKSLYRYEQKVLKKYMAGSAISEQERVKMEEMVDGIHTFLVPNGVDTKYFQPSPSTSIEDEKNIVFTGAYSYYPNEQAAYYFATNVFPDILQRIPEIKFYIVGPSPSQQLLALQNENIIVTGEVEDIRPFLLKADVVVAPIYFGSGTKNKILEALSSGKAVVTTTLGREGIEVENGEHLLIADEDEAFASAVVALTYDRDKSSELGKAGRNLIEEKYSWDKIIEEFNISLEEYVEKFKRQLIQS